MRRVALHVVLVALALVSCTPFFWLICATLKRPEDFFAYAFLPWRHPERWTLSNYADLFVRSADAIHSGRIWRRSIRRRACWLSW